MLTYVRNSVRSMEVHHLLLNNIVSKLKKMGVFIKDGTKVKVNPIILLNFDKDIILQISLIHG